MELEAVPQLGNDHNLIEEMSPEHSTPPGSPDISYVCGNPQLKPRVGDEYQAEIPLMPTETEHVHLSINPVDSVVRLDVSHSFLMGLPVPIVWVKGKLNNKGHEGREVPDNHDDSVDINESLKSIKSKRSRTSTKKKGLKQKVEELENERSKPANLEANVASRTTRGPTTERKKYGPIPGSVHDPWSEAEVDSLLLGLYIFGKDFIRVNRFMENKDMGDILSFYYGEFYKSDKYRRWCDCRKSKNKKCIYGRKIFQGWTQQELLSRLLPHVSEEQKNSLLEVSKSFAEGSTELEKYVSSLKRIVGVCVLVEAVCIGKGKEDLTGFAMEPEKSKQVFTLCPEIPTGKACSTLTSGEIIKFLTGGFRLGKARCNDIFWEAVWPRLLARGWESEEPKNQVFITSNSNLVFLMPGVKNFSRRKLIRGEHFFDSVSDVLKKVASEPELIELEAQELKVSSSNEVPSDQDDPSDRKPHHHYLKPRVSTCSSDLMKFTIVDTSLASDGKSSRVRELRCAPVDSTRTSIVTQKENEGCSAENQLIKPEANASKNESDMRPNGGESISGDADCNDGKTDETLNPHCANFTIVDTSLVHGGKPSRARQLRCSPVEFSHEMDAASGENEGSFPDNLKGEQDRSTALVSGNGKQGRADPQLDSDPGAANMGVFDSECSDHMAVECDTKNKMLKGNNDQKMSTVEGDQSKRNIKQQFSRRSKACDSANLTPLTKRRRLTACVKSEMSRITENSLVGKESKQVKPCGTLTIPNARTNVLLVKTSQENGLPIISSSEGDAKDDSGGDINSGACCGMEIPSENGGKHQLNTEADDNQGKDSNGSCSLSEINKLDSKALEASTNVGAMEQQPCSNPRRHSTRNRPLTTRVLEALESGFFMEKQQKSTEVRKQTITFSSPSRKARSKVKVVSGGASSGAKILNAKIEKGKDGASIVKQRESSKPPDGVK